MHIINKEFTFEAAHRLLNHPGKCNGLHGHSYRIVVELQAAELPKTGPTNGMVFDYGDLSIIKEFIDNTLDHKYICSQELIDAGDPIYLYCEPGWRAVLPLLRTSTAEELAKWFFNTWKDAIPQLTAVTICETAKTSATYRFERGLR